MKYVALLAGAAVVLDGPVATESPRPCAIEGELIQWQADYCLFRTGTDDIIAAGPCLEREAAVRFRTDCDGKRRYKRILCEYAIADGRKSGTIEACVTDPSFVGSTVRNGGA